MNTAMQVSFDLFSVHRGNPGAAVLGPFAGIYRWNPQTGCHLLKTSDRGMQYLGVLLREAYGSQISWTLGLFKGPIATTANQNVFVARRTWGPVINIGDPWVAQGGSVVAGTTLPFVHVQGPFPFRA